MANYSENLNPRIIKSTDEQYKRTNTRLIKDDGNHPSGKNMVDPKLPKKFQYHFGNPFGAQEWVVIPKGRIVSIVPDAERKSFDDNKYYNMVTIANGGTDVSEDNHDPLDESEQYTRVANKPVGVSTLNVYQDLDNEFAGNVPNYTTRSTVNLPLFKEKEDAEQMEWGSAYGELKPGDLVKSDENGRFVKWNEDGEGEESGDSIEQIIGRVHKRDSNLIPAGWLKWAMPEYNYGSDSNTGISVEDIGEDGMPYDSQYRDGYGGDMYRPTGIPGLTDGMNYTKSYEDVSLGTLNAGMEEGDRVQLRLPDKYTPVTDGTVVYKVDGVEVAKDNATFKVYHTDSEVGLFSVELKQDLAEDVEVVINFDATHQMPGMPTNLDWDGVVGSVDIVINL